MERHRRGDFVRGDDLTFERVPGALLLLGTIQCRGGIYIRVEKVIKLLDESEDPRAVRSSYTYNVALEGQGNIFRYDSPHPDGHRSVHHVHRGKPLDPDQEEVVEPILDEDDTPHLSEVIDEAEEWYYDHLSELEGL